MRNKTRYFYATYLAEIQNGTSTGTIDFFNKEGLYPSRSVLIKKIREANEEIKNVVILNIIEMTESDYNEWILE